MNKTRIAAVFFLGCSLGLAQEVDSVIRIDHYTKSDLDRQAAAQEEVKKAVDAAEEVEKQIRREHGVVDHIQGSCSPFDSVENREGTTFLVTRVTPTPDDKGKCDSDGSGEGFAQYRKFRILS